MKKGFTLIEMIIYIGLFSIIIGGAIVSAYNIFESTDRNQTKAMMAEEGMFIIGKIDWALTGAKTADVYSSNKLSVERIGIPPAENPIVFDINNGELRLKRGDGDPQILNNANVKIDNLTFVHSVSSNSGSIIESISASFKMLAKTPEGMKISEDFHTIKYLKK